MTPKQTILSPADARPDVSIFVSTDLRTFFTSEVVNGHGGFQSLARMLAERLATSATLQLTDVEFARIVHYATNYGDGGFQTRLRLLVTHWVNQHYARLTGASHAIDQPSGRHTSGPADQRANAAHRSSKRRG